MSITAHTSPDPVRAGRFLAVVLDWKIEQERLAAGPAVAAETEMADGVGEMAHSGALADGRTISRHQRADRSTGPAQE